MSLLHFVMWGCSRALSRDDAKGFWGGERRAVRHAATISLATMDERAFFVGQPDSHHNRCMADLPVACTLSPAALHARRENLLNALLQRTKERRELPNGYSLRFAAESGVPSEIARTVDNE